MEPAKCKHPDSCAGPHCYCKPLEKSVYDSNDLLFDEGMQYADLPPTGYEIMHIEWVIEYGNMVFFNGRWQLVKQGQNIAGTTAYDEYPQIMAAARKRVTPNRTSAAYGSGVPKGKHL